MIFFNFNIFQLRAWKIFIIRRMDSATDHFERVWLEKLPWIRLQIVSKESDQNKFSWIRPQNILKSPMTKIVIFPFGGHGCHQPFSQHLRPLF